MLISEIKNKAYKRLMELENVDKDTWETLKFRTEIEWNNMTDVLSFTKFKL